MKTYKFNVLALVIVFIFIFSIPVSAKDFDLVCLGSGGGDFSDNIVSFMVKPDGLDYYSLLLDGGSIAEGILAYGAENGLKLDEMDPED